MAEQVHLYEEATSAIFDIFHLPICYYIEYHGLAFDKNCKSILLSQHMNINAYNQRIDYFWTKY